MKALVCWYLSINAVYASEQITQKENKPPLFSWAGMYLGMNSGVGVPLHPNEHLHANGGRDIQTIDLYPSSHVRTGITFGAQAGYNWQKDYLVYGVETDFNYLDGWGGGKSGFYPTPAFFRPEGIAGYWLNYQQPVNFYASMRLRAGLAFDRLLIYGTGGVALGGTRGPATLMFLADEKVKDFPVWLRVFEARQSFSRRMKYILGAGMEYAFLDDTSLRFEAF